MRTQGFVRGVRPGRAFGAVAAAGVLLMAGCSGDDSAAPTTLITLQPTTSLVDPCSVVPTEPLPVSVRWSNDPPIRQNETTTWNIVVRNTSTSPIVVPFASGQTADITMRNSAGEVVYQYSEGRSFTEASECKPLPVGASFTLSFSEERPFTVQPGTYNLEIDVLIDGAPVQTKDFVAVGTPVPTN